jgi:phosphate transport system substrate-binding protein
MRRVLTLALGLLVPALVNAQTPVIRVGGGTAIQAIFEPIRSHFLQDRGILLELSECGPDAAFLDLEAGKLDAAVAGTSMEGWLAMMKAKGHPVKAMTDYKHMQIGEDHLSVLINPDVVTDVDVLTMDLDKPRIQKLFTGAVKNWKELGGPDMPVVVVLGRKNAGANKEFQDKALDGKPFSPDAWMVGTVPEIIQALVGTKGAVGIGPLVATRDTKIWSPAQAPQIVRPFTLLMGENLDAAKKKHLASMVEYIQGAGAAYLK